MGKSGGEPGQLSVLADFPEPRNLPGPDASQRGPGLAGASRESSWMIWDWIHLRWLFGLIIAVIELYQMEDPRNK